MRGRRPRGKQRPERGGRRGAPGHCWDRTGRRQCDWAGLRLRMGRSAHETAAALAHNRHVPVDTATFIDQLPHRVQATGDRAEVESLLTEGYSRALALEGESRRLQARVNALAAGMNGAGDATAIELAELARRRAEVDGEYARLREALALLRRRLAA